MHSDYSFEIDEQQMAQLVREGAWAQAFDMLAAPLHEWLYQEQHFEALDSRTALERLILSFDYVQMQVGQGGFIQLIQNGYVSLLVTVIETLQVLGLAPQMIPVLDDALKVFVLNKDVLGRQTSVAAFGRLYQEFGEFEALEERFNAIQPILLRSVTGYALMEN